MNRRRGGSAGLQEPLLESLVAPEQEDNAKKLKSSKFTSGKEKEIDFHRVNTQPKTPWWAEDGAGYQSGGTLLWLRCCGVKVRHKSHEFLKETPVCEAPRGSQMSSFPPCLHTQRPLLPSLLGISQISHMLCCSSFSILLKCINL